MIRPLVIQDGYVWLRHDRELVDGDMVGGHDGVTAIADLRHPLNPPSDQAREAFLELPCPKPDCPWMSIQPIGGGGLSEQDTWTLQTIFVEKRRDTGLTLGEAFEQVCLLIEQTDGAHRNELLKPATPVEIQKLSMPTEAEQPTQTQSDETEIDLGAAIIAEIAKTLEIAPRSKMSPILAEIIDYALAQRRIAAHYQDALGRIQRTLEAASQLRDERMTGV